MASPPRSVLLVAFGSRGDVQPPLAVLAQLLHEESGCRAGLITHDAHEEWLRHHLPPRCELFTIDTPVLREPPAAAGGEQARGGGALRAAHASRRAGPGLHAAGWAAAVEAGHRAALLQAAARCVRRERPGAPPPLLLFNLFALEAAHVAEALACPAAALAPYLMPYTMPRGVGGALERHFPRLAAALRAAPPGRVSWREVEHWMWPLFSPTWRAWRQDVLRLPGVPLLGVEGGGELPPPTPLLYGVSPAISPPPGYWPPSVAATGLWLWPQHTPPRPPPEWAAALATAQALAAAGRPLLALDFGSSARLPGVLPRLARLLTALCGAALDAGCAAVLVTGGWQPLQQACGQAVAAACASRAAAGGDAGAAARLQLLPCAPPHDALLRHCAVLVHAGGAGAAAAAAAAGLPQLLVPIHFDQFATAERLCYLGVAASVGLPPAESEQRQPCQGQEQLGRRGALQQELAAAVCAVLSDAMRDAASQLSKAVAAEPGVVGAAAALWPLLRADSAGRAPEAQASQAGGGEASGVGQSLVAALDGMAQRAASALQSCAVPPPHAADGSRGGSGGEAGERGLGISAQDTGLQVAGQHVLLVELGLGGPGGGALRAATTGPREAAHLLRELWQDGGYLRHGVSVGAGDEVLDVGANIGLFAAQLLLRGAGAAPAAVWAVEPLPPNRELLRINCGLWGLDECQVRVLPCGATDDATLAACGASARFAWWPDAPGNATLALAEKLALQGALMAALPRPAQYYECRLQTLSALVDAHGMQRIDLLKVDVEGAELAVLRGLAPRHWPRVRQVAVEVHDVEGRLQAVTALLREHGLRIAAVEAGAVPRSHTVFALRDGASLP